MNLTILQIKNKKILPPDKATVDHVMLSLKTLARLDF